MEFDPDSFLASRQSTQEPTSKNESLPDSIEFDPDAFLASRQSAQQMPSFDPEAPPYAKGDSADSPIVAESALDVADRFKLGFGNKAGNIEYLKQKFGEANVVENSLGQLVVKANDGKWKAVDADTGDAPDSWSWTQKLQNKMKETASEVAENIPTAARMASGLLRVGGAATAAATGAPTLGAGALAGGTAFAAGALTDAALTSFGRSLGTYKGSEWDQAKDAMFEGALNTLGVAFEAGVKPTLGYLAKTGAVKKMKAGLASLTDDNLRVLSGLVKWSTGGKVSEDAIEQIAKNGDEVQRLINSQGNLNYDAFKGNIQLETAKIAKEAAQLVKATKSQIGERLYGSIADDVAEGTFKATNADLIDPIMSQYAKDGLLKIAGKSFDETTELLAKQGGKLAPGQSWEIAKQSDLLAAAQRNPDLSRALKQAAAESDVYNQVTKPLQAMLQYRNFAAPKSSKEQVKAIVNLRKSLGDITLDAKNSATANAVDQFYAQANTGIDSILKSVLPKNAVDKLAQADEIYKDYLTTNKILLDIAESKDFAQADQLVNAIFSRGGAGARKRASISEAKKLMAANGASAAAERLAKLEEQVLIRKAATEFTAPMARIVGPAQLAAAAAATGGAGSSGDPLLGGAAGATALALTSPRVGYHLLRGQLGANALIRQGVSKIADPIKRSEWTNTAVSQLVPLYLRMQAEEETTRESLLQQVQP